jgi:hypothetical protein
MTDANYIRHFSALGKLCWLYDNASAQADDLNDWLAATYDQVATGTSESLPNVTLFASYNSRLANGISSGATALKATALALAREYVTRAEFTDDLTTQPASRTAALAMAALAADMGAGVDNKTLGTLAATGLANFLNVVAGAVQTWNTEADATADYRDAIYVVATVV